MRRTKLTIWLAALLILVILIIWKVLSLMSQDKKVYSEILLQSHAINDVISECLTGTSRDRSAPSNVQDLHIDRNHEQQRKKGRSCDAGSILKDGGCSLCPDGTFSFPNSIACENHLGCDQVRYEVRTSDSLYTVGTWDYKLAEWRGYEVLHATMTVQEREITFEPRIIDQLCPHPNLLYPIGFCKDDGIVIFSKPSKIRGLAHRLNSMLTHHDKCDHWLVRYHLSIDFIQILVHLHTTAASGPVVLCNSNSLKDTLSQFLVTDNWRLVLATLDNLPQIKKSNDRKLSLVKCSRHELKGDFVAPEQRWPFSHTKVFNINQQPGYTEAADVWKIPDITEAIMGKSEQSRYVLNHLSFIHYRCKDFDPSARPTASEILSEYERVWKMLVLPDTLNKS